MADLQIDDLNVASNETLITPEQLKREIPLTDKALQTVAHGRQVVRDILDGKDHRLFVVIGPCSIHDIKAAHEYADRLKALAAEVADTLFLVMRVYFEKPRTTVGWKGLINDPYLDDSFKIRMACTSAANCSATSPRKACPPPPKRSTRFPRSTCRT